MEQLTLILDNVRSAHNVGGIIRNAAGFGVRDIACVGITPYPPLEDDSRLPHVMHQAAKRIEKTALGAQQHCQFIHFATLEEAIASYKKQGVAIYALEMGMNSCNLREFSPRYPAALILGSEVAGISKQHLAQADAVVEIPTATPKRSLNVTTASGIALYHFASHGSE